MGIHLFSSGQTRPAWVARLLSPFAAVMLGPHLLIAAPSGVPVIDIQNTCKIAAGSMTIMAGSTVQSAIESCLRSEHGARDQLVKDWATYPATDKARCVQVKVYLPSYIEWLTCLEMERDVRALRKAAPR
jgi:hypothetical protein